MQAKYDSHIISSVHTISKTPLMLKTSIIWVEVGFVRFLSREVYMHEHLKHTYLAWLKTVGVIEDKGNLRNFHSPGKVYGTVQLNLIWYF